MCGAVRYQAGDADKGGDAVKVVEWISREESESYETSIGGLGGWVDGEKWEVYAGGIKPELKEYYEALRNAIIVRKLKYTGAQHQDKDDGTPLFEDDTVAHFSFRAWGDLMAAIWNTEEDGTYSYMDFYC